MRTAEVAAWINEREAVRLRKDSLQIAGARPLTNKHHGCQNNLLAWGEIPLNGVGAWTLDRLTDDPILGKFRFCNVRREDDRVTRWIRQHIIEPYADHELLWLMLAIARTINWPPTLQELIIESAWPIYGTFRPEYLTRVLEQRKRRGDKVYTGAYMIRAASSPAEHYFTWTKQRYISEIVIGKLWESRHDWQHLMEPGEQDSEGVWEYFQLFIGWGPFMAYQVIVDLQHTRYLRDAPDKQTWAAAGPGTLRGLNRWNHQEPGEPLRQDEALERLRALRGQLNEAGLLAPWVTLPLDLSDVCNVMCEFDKYERVRLGEGRPRALYVPGRGH